MRKLVAGAVAAVSTALVPLGAGSVGVGVQAEQFPGGADGCISVAPFADAASGNGVYARVCQYIASRPGGYAAYSPQGTSRTVYDTLRSQNICGWGYCEWVLRVWDSRGAHDGGRPPRATFGSNFRSSSCATGVVQPGNFVEAVTSWAVLVVGNPTPAVGTEVIPGNVCPDTGPIIP